MNWVVSRINIINFLFLGLIMHFDVYLLRLPFFVNVSKVHINKPLLDISIINVKIQ